MVAFYVFAGFLALVFFALYMLDLRRWNAVLNLYRGQQEKQHQLLNETVDAMHKHSLLLQKLYFSIRSFKITLPCIRNMVNQENENGEDYDV